MYSLPSLKTEKVLSIIVIALAFLAIMGWDYSMALGDIYRGGRIRYLLMAFAVCQYIYLRGINPWWAAFSAWSFFLWCYFDFSGFGAADVALIPAALIVGEVIRKNLKSSWVLAGIAWLALAQGVFAFGQVLGIDPLFPNIEPLFKNKALGTFGHHTVLAPFLALGFTYFLANARWKLSFTLLAFLLLTKSSMGVGAALVGALYVLWRHNQRVGLIAGVLAALGILGGFALFPSAEVLSFSGRMAVWPAAFEGVLQSPVLGHGPGSYLEKHELWGLGFRGVAHMSWDQVHMEYLQTWIEQGIIGLLIVLGGIYWLMVHAQKLHPVYGAWVVVLAANSLANFPMHIASFGLIAGWLAATIWQKRSE